MKETDLLGVWRLLSWVLIDEHQHRSSIYGDNPCGYLIYTKEGIVAANLSQSNPPLFQNESYFAAQPEEVFEHFQHFFSYSGRYEVQGDVVLHHVQVCSLPNWVGKTQQRHAKLQDNKLYITHAFDNKSTELVWQKVS